MFIAILGTVAATLSTLSFIPQVVKAWKTKQTKDISLPMYLALITASVLWFTYGILLQAPPIYLSNALILLFSLSILFLKLRHG